MTLGKRIKETRLKKGIKQKELAKMLNISENTMYRWEAGLNSPSDKDKGRLAEILGVSIAYLMGETGCSVPTGVTVLRTASPSKHIELPLIAPCIFTHPKFMEGSTNDAMADCAEFITLPSYMVGLIGKHKPFAIKVEGESMEDADIPSGCEVAVNPEADIYNGDPVLICFGSKSEWAIKWIYWDKDGGAEFKSASPQYPYLSFTKDDVEKGWCRIIGKIMKTIVSPKKGI